MKEFKKWNNDNPIFDAVILDEWTGYDVDGEKELIQERKNGWKAALKWLYNKLEYSEEDKRVKDIIDKELEE